MGIGKSYTLYSCYKKESVERKECGDAEQYWISLGNERQSAPQCHLHIIFLTMIRLVEWTWCWFACQGDFSIRKRFTVKRREIEKPTSWICAVKRGRGAYCPQLADDFPRKKCSELFMDNLDNREICCVCEWIPKKHPFDKVVHIACAMVGGRIICTIPKRKVDFSRIPSQSVPKNTYWET